MCGRCLCWCFLIFTWVEMSAVAASTAGGSYECRPIRWTYGQKVSIELRIDRSKFPSLCTQGTNGLAYFQSSSDDTFYKVNCSVTTDIRTSCSFPAGSLGCGCVNSNDNGFYFIEYNFIAAPDYNRWWRAEIPCLDSSFSPALSLSNINCDNIPVLTTTRPPPPVLTTTRPPPPPVQPPQGTSLHRCFSLQSLPLRSLLLLIFESLI